MLKLLHILRRPAHSGGSSKLELDELMGRDSEAPSEIIAELLPTNPTEQGPRTERPKTSFQRKAADCPHSVEDSLLRLGRGQQCLDTVDKLLRSNKKPERIAVA